MNKCPPDLSRKMCEVLKNGRIKAGLSHDSAARKISEIVGEDVGRQWIISIERPSCQPLSNLSRLSAACKTYGIEFREILLIFEDCA